jgi:general secretion pathway protein G
LEFETMTRIRRRRHGFTLIEVLLVLAILVVLGAIVGVNVMNAQRRAQADTAKAQIGSLEGLMQQYALDVGSFPTTDQGLEALNAAPGDLRNPSKWRGPYSNKEIPADPWGNPYQYELEGADQIRIWSFGPDRQSGTADDITN